MRNFITLFLLFSLTTVNADIEIRPSLAEPKLECGKLKLHNQKMKKGFVQRSCIDSKKRPHGIVKVITIEDGKEQVVLVRKTEGGVEDPMMLGLVRKNNSPLLWMKHNRENGKLKSITIQPYSGSPFKDMSTDEFQSFVYDAIDRKIENKIKFPCSTYDFASSIECDEGTYKYIGSNLLKKVLNTGREGQTKTPEHLIFKGSDFESKKAGGGMGASIPSSSSSTLEN
jgi:hypothetical protein